MNTASEKQSQIFDMMRDNLEFDMGRILWNVAKEIFCLPQDAITNGENNMASEYASRSPSVKQNLSDFMKEIDEMDQK